MKKQQIFCDICKKEIKGNRWDCSSLPQCLELNLHSMNPFNHFQGNALCTAQKAIVEFQDVCPSCAKKLVKGIFNIVDNMVSASICDTAPYPQCNGANGCDTCEYQEENLKIKGE